MMQEEISGFIDKTQMSDYLIEASFILKEELPSHGIYRLVKAMRYGRWYLLKGLRPEYSDKTPYITLLHKEFEIVVGLDSHEIVNVISFERVPDLGLCIVMEWIDGESLDNWLPGKNRRMKRQVLDQILTGVEYIHLHQIVHRDLKPSNIMITRNGAHAKIIDFGLADSDNDERFKQPGGTLGYISPEQCESRVPDQRNDIYSIGCIISDMELGWKAERVARRCKRAIDKRYSNISQVRKALHRPWWLLYILAIFVVAGIVMALTIDKEDYPIYIQSDPDAVYEELTSEIIRCDTMEFIRFSDMGNTVEASMGYAPPNKWLHVPKQIVYKGDTLTIIGIGYRAFADACFSFVELPKTLEYIRDFAFWNAGIHEVTVPDSVKCINRAAFARCHNLRKVTLGKSVSEIGIDLFNGSNMIKEVWIRRAKPPILDDMSAYDYDATLYVPRGSAQYYRNAVNWRRFKNIVEVDYSDIGSTS